MRRIRFDLTNRNYMKTSFFILVLLTSIFNSWSQCDTPSPPVSNVDCSTVSPSDIISGGSVNSGEVKYFTGSNPSNLAVSTGGVLYICADVNLSIGSGSNLLSMNGGTLVISSCASVTLNAGASPTYINSGCQIVNYGTLNITQSGSYIRIDNGAKLFNYANLNMEGITFLRDGSIINDNQNNHSYIEVLTMRMGSGGSTQYALSTSKVCLSENSCLENSVLVNGTSSNWLDYGGGLGGARLYGTTNLTGNSGSVSNDSEINVCTTDNDTRWGSTSYSAVGNITSCTACLLITPCINILPIEMLFLTVEQVNNNVELTWGTNNEYDMDRFEIERLTAEGEEWGTLGEVESIGTSVGESDYSFIDNSPSVGMNYYRLKQFDTDGQFEYSTMKSVDLIVNTTQVSPNPSSGILNIIPPNSIRNIEIQLTDMQGRVVYETFRPESTKISLDLNGEYQGVFILRIVAEGYSSFHHVIFQ
ncbi:MAG: hypothetical protein COA38_18995 [Fluviicola sp.]|nr:MAG: hypothetical protein COA38_18995 [Fluviicola sp.]